MQQIVLDILSTAIQTYDSAEKNELTVLDVMTLAVPPWSGDQNLGPPIRKISEYFYSSFFPPSLPFWMPCTPLHIPADLLHLLPGAAGPGPRP